MAQATKSQMNELILINNSSKVVLDLSDFINEWEQKMNNELIDVSQEFYDAINSFQNVIESEYGQLHTRAQSIVKNNRLSL